MATRNELFRQFGPILLESITDFIFDNVNELREEQGMDPKPKQEYLDTLSNHVTELEPYDWMQEGPW